MSSWRSGRVISLTASSKIPSCVTARTPTTAATAPPARNRRRRALACARVLRFAFAAGRAGLRREPDPVAEPRLRFRFGDCARSRAAADIACLPSGGLELGQESIELSLEILERPVVGHDEVRTCGLLTLGQLAAVAALELLEPAAG